MRSGVAAGTALQTILDLLRRERGGRLFFAAYAQSALGNGAGVVALVVLAYARGHSAWAIALVLMAEFLPSMALGPLLGAAADRWPRRWCLVASDLVRAGAFIGIGFVGGIEATLALALVAGAGAGAFTPAALASLPELVDERRLPAATSLYGALTDLGRTAGPGIAALVLLLGAPESIAVANGATFLVSAAILAALPVKRTAPAERGPAAGLLREAREGIVAAARTPGIRVLVLASSGILLFLGTLNVGVLLLARELGAGSAGYSVLEAVFGVGFVAGSLTGVRASAPFELKRRYLAGMLVIALGTIASGAAPGFAVAIGAFAVTGFGNGVLLVHERLIFQAVVPDRLKGRLFAVIDTAGSWAFAISFACAGAFVSVLGTRGLFELAGVCGLAIFAGSAWALRTAWRPTAPRLGEPAVAET